MSNIFSKVVLICLRYAILRLKSIATDIEDYLYLRIGTHLKTIWHKSMSLYFGLFTNRQLLKRIVWTGKIETGDIVDLLFFKPRLTFLIYIVWIEIRQDLLDSTS